MLWSRRRVLVAGLGAVATVATGCQVDRGAAPSGSTGTGPGEPAVSSGGQVSIPQTSLAEKIEAFLVAPDVNSAAFLALDMGASGDVGWVPYLVDLLRLAGEEEGTEQILVALQKLTGRYVLNDVGVAFVEYGGWVLEEQPEPAPGYLRWKATLYGRIDPSFATILYGMAGADMSTTDTARLLSEIHWGGVIRGGIPELNRPRRVGAQQPEAGYLRDDELVFGVSVQGVAVAYPERILGYHELANDVIGGTGVIASYCPLCRSARAFRAEGRTMQSSGLLRSSNKLMVARVPVSDPAAVSDPADPAELAGITLWQQINGEALSGPERSSRLTPLEMETLTWLEWRTRHPSTEVLVRPDPAQFPSTSYRYEPQESYRTYDADSGAWFPVLKPPGNLDLKATVATVVSGDATLAIDMAALARAGPSVIAWAGSFVELILAVPSPSGARLYDATGLRLTPGPVSNLARSDDQTAVLSDGTSLARIPSGRAVWFAWYAEHRTTTWWPT